MSFGLFGVPGGGLSRPVPFHALLDFIEGRNLIEEQEAQPLRRCKFNRRLTRGPGP